MTTSTIPADYLMALIAECRKVDRVTTVWIQTPDQRGDGYDIACMPRDDQSIELQKALTDAGILVAVTTIRASGYLCGYQLTINPASAPTQLRLCQHSGAWGPWYHVSEYQGTRYIASHGGHYNHNAAKKLGLPFGRPSKAGQER